MIFMSSFCLESLLIVALLSMYNIVPDPLFISGDARPFVKVTPRSTFLVPTVAIPALKVVSIAALKPSDVTALGLDSNASTFPRESTSS